MKGILAFISTLVVFTQVACLGSGSSKDAPGAGGVRPAAGITSGGTTTGGAGGFASGGALPGGEGGGAPRTGGLATGGGAPRTGGLATGGEMGTTGGAMGSGGVQVDAGSVGGSSGRDADPPRDVARDGASSTDGPPKVDAPVDPPKPDAAPPSGVKLPPFILGADVTITLEDEYWGATYTDNGQAKPLEQILKDHGFNFIRIDTFVNPGAAGGYASDKPEAFRDLAHAIKLGKRVKAVGMGIMLNLHYSDTWTSPSQHATPAAWAGLSLSALETKVYDYTKDALTQMQSQGAKPDMVSVGNEITNGMLWETGRVANNNFANFATLLKAGVRAVREMDPTIVVVMHIEKCNNYTTTKWWLDGVLAQGVSFDVLGQSCYATAPNGVAGYQGTPTEWKNTFTQLASAYPTLKFLISEYSAEQRAAGDVMFGLPNSRGLGTFNWDPTRAYDTHPNDPLFSTNGAWNRYVAIPSKMALYEQMAKDFGSR